MILCPNLQLTMHIKTLKRATDDLDIRDRQKQSQEQMAELRQELQRHKKEMELKFERKLTEFIVHIDKFLNTRMYDAEREERENLPINDIRKWFAVRCKKNGGRKPNE